MHVQFFAIIVDEASDVEIVVLKEESIVSIKARTKYCFEATTMIPSDRPLTPAVAGLYIQPAEIAIREALLKKIPELTK